MDDLILKFLAIFSFGVVVLCFFLISKFPFFKYVAVIIACCLMFFSYNWGKFKERRESNRANGFFVKTLLDRLSVLPSDTLPTRLKYARDNFDFPKSGENEKYLLEKILRGGQEGQLLKPENPTKSELKITKRTQSN